MKVNKMIRTASLIMAVIALVVINVIGFLVGSEHFNFGSFIMVIVFSNLLIFSEEVLILLETKSNKGTLYRLLGAPLHFWAFMTIAVQIVFSLVVTIVNRFVSFPLMAVIIVEILLTAFFIIQFVLGFLVRFFSLGLDSRIEEKTSKFEQFRKRIEVAKISETKEDVKKALEEVCEKMRYMNPVSDKCVDNVDELIGQKIKEIEDGINSSGKDSWEAILVKIDDLRKLLSKRDILLAK